MMDAFIKKVLTPSTFESYTKNLRIVAIAMTAIVLAVTAYGMMSGLAAGNYFDDNYESYNDSNEDIAYHPGLYDDYADDFLIPGSDEYYIDDSLVSDWDIDTTQWAINEIYARHGRIFSEDPYYSHFYSCDWYEPTYRYDEFDDSWFNDYEHENLRVLAAHREKLR